MRERFAPGYWGALRQFEVPVSIIEKELILKSNALAMLLILLESAKTASYRRSRVVEQLIEVQMSQNTLVQRSGLSKDRITAGMQELERKRFIRQLTQRRRGGEFGANIYQLCNPADGEPLLSGGTNILHRNNLRYLRLPSCLVRESTADWSLAHMSGSEVKLYVVLCWLANKNRGGQFQMTESELKSLASLSTLPTMRNALGKIEDKRLVFIARSGSAMDTEMLDPYTGEPPYLAIADSANDPANYKALRDGGREVRLNLNTGTPEQVKQLLLDSLPQNAAFSYQQNGNVMIRCPFHTDNTPSCSVNVARRVFHCFGCQKSGRLRELVAQLWGASIGEAVAVLGEALGEQVVYREPDLTAEAIYSYQDAKGTLVKQVLRFPGKRFSQRRPARNGGWISNTDGVPPILYNLMRVQFATVVCICEGEKDCDVLNGLSLFSATGGDVVATTSGGAESWHDELADHLRGKRVALMPDDDEAGARYAGKIRASLQQRGIEFRSVSFRDAGAKDLSDFIAAGGSKEELVERIGTDWLVVTEPLLFATPHEFEPA